MLKLNLISYSIVAALLALTIGIYYLNWPHPEVFTACLAFGAYLGFLSGSRIGPFVCLAIASWQNPSAIFLVAPFCIQDLWLAFRSRNGLWQHIVRIALKFLPGALCFVIPFVFFRWKFGVFSLIATHGYLDSSLISVSRLLSIVLEPDQGLFFWSPLALLLPAYVIFRHARKEGAKYSALLVAGALLAFILAATPTLAQINWNAGSTGPIRYAVWQVTPLLALTAFMLHRLSTSSGKLASWCLALIAFQLLWTIRLAGLPAQANYLEVEPTAEYLIQHAAKIAPWDAEILYERIRHKEGWDGPNFVSVRSKNAHEFAALSVSKPGFSLDTACGQDGVLTDSIGRPFHSIAKAGAGEIALGEHRCTYRAGSVIAPTNESLGQLVLAQGFAPPESWGTWAIGQTSSIDIPFIGMGHDVVAILWLRAFEGYKELPTEVVANGCTLPELTVASDTFRPYKLLVPYHCLTGANLKILLTQSTEIKSAAQLGMQNGDDMARSISVREIELAN